jgi:asparagine synthase (glutamine-hydrolysing)
MLLYDNDGQDPTAVTALLQELERLNPVSRGLLSPHGEAMPLDNIKRLLGFVPSSIETFSARSVKMRGLLAEDFLKNFGDREPHRALFSDLDVRGQLIGRAPVQPRRGSIAFSATPRSAVRSRLW